MRVNLTGAIRRRFWRWQQMEGSYGSNENFLHSDLGTPSVGLWPTRGRVPSGLAESYGTDHTPRNYRPLP